MPTAVGSRSRRRRLQQGLRRCSASRAHHGAIVVCWNRRPCRPPPAGRLVSPHERRCRLGRVGHRLDHQARAAGDQGRAGEEAVSNSSSLTCPSSTSRRWAPSTQRPWPAPPRPAGNRGPGSIDFSRRSAAPWRDSRKRSAPRCWSRSSRRPASTYARATPDEFGMLQIHKSGSSIGSPAAATGSQLRSVPGRRPPGLQSCGARGLQGVKSRPSNPAATHAQPAAPAGAISFSLWRWLMVIVAFAPPRRLSRSERRQTRKLIWPGRCPASVGYTESAIGVGG